MQRVQLSYPCRRPPRDTRRVGKHVSSLCLLESELLLRSVVEVRTISLEEKWDAFVPYSTMSFSTPPAKRLYLPDHPVQGTKVIQDISITDHILIVVVAICGAQGGVSSHILLTTSDAGPLKWVDPKFTHVST